MLTLLGDGQASYQYGLGLVSEVRGGASRIYHSDSLGTTRTMSDASGAASANLETDAFGNTISQTAALGTPFGFAGQHGYQSDADSGLMRLGYRYYDASVGRFLSRDPIRDGYNWYTYCDNDPVNAVDPEGLFSIPRG